MAQQVQSMRAIGRLGGRPVGSAFEGFSVFVVGGAVRDALRGERPTDIDLMAVPQPGRVSENPAETLAEREAMTPIEPSSSFPVFLDDRNREVALPRTKDGTGASFVSPDVPVARAVETDLRHRDLTINAIVFDLRAGELIDPLDGAKDLRRGVLRPVSESFSDDPIRVLRMARFAASLNFTIPENEREIPREAVPDLVEVPGERIAIEIRKTFERADQAGEFFRILDEFGANAIALHEIKFTKIKSFAARLDALDSEAARWIALGEEIGKDTVNQFANRLALSAKEQMTLTLGACRLSSIIEAATASEPEDGMRAAMKVVKAINDDWLDATTDDMLAVAKFVTGSRAFDPERAKTRVEGIRQAQEQIDGGVMFDRLNIKPSDLDDPEVEIDGTEFGRRLRLAQENLAIENEQMR